jgi:hypothetical protein
MDNLNLLKDIKTKNEEIKKLKSIILELYSIIKCAEDEDNIKIINLTYGTITILLKQILDLED